MADKPQPNKSYSPLSACAATRTSAVFKKPVVGLIFGLTLWLIELWIGQVGVRGQKTRRNTRLYVCAAASDEGIGCRFVAQNDIAAVFWPDVLEVSQW